MLKSKAASELGFSCKEENGIVQKFVNHEYVDFTPEEQATIEARTLALQAEYDASEYIRERKKLHESKSPYEQIEMIVNDMKDVLQGGTFMTWYEANKSKYPKP